MAIFTGFLKFSSRWRRRGFWGHARRQNFEATLSFCLWVLLCICYFSRCKFLLDSPTVSARAATRLVRLARAAARRSRERRPRTTTPELFFGERCRRLILDKSSKSAVLGRRLQESLINILSDDRAALKSILQGAPLGRCWHFFFRFPTSRWPFLQVF